MQGHFKNVYIIGKTDCSRSRSSNNVWQYSRV